MRDSQSTIEDDGTARATINGAQIEITPEGRTVVFSAAPIKREGALADGDSGPDMASVCLSGYGVTVAAAADGRLTVYTNGPVTTKPLVADAKPAIGDTDEDGWMYAGVSPDNGRALFLAPADAGVMSWKRALKAAKVLHKHGVDARLPSSAEMRVVFNNRARLGIFNAAAARQSGMYWTAGPPDHACFGYMQMPQEPSRGDRRDEQPKISVRFVKG